MDRPFTLGWGPHVYNSCHLQWLGEPLDPSFPTSQGPNILGHKEFSVSPQFHH